MKFERNLNSFKYENQSTNYLIKTKQFEFQYAPLYAQRLVTMKQKLMESIQAKNWQNYQVKQLADVIKNEKCVIIGCIYKEMQNKPNILKELAEDGESGLLSIQQITLDIKYIDPENDKLILEDESQRITLVDSVNSDIVKRNILCTGMVIALLGSENENSEFEIDDYVFKQTPIYESKVIPSSLAQKSDQYIVFLSGLELGNDSDTNNFLFKLQLLVDFLRGDFIDEVSDYSSQVTNTIRLVIVGNSLSSSTQSKDIINKAKYLTKNYVAGSVDAIKKLDDFLLQLIENIEVDIMPGEFDPSNYMLPQQPLNHSMLTKAINSDFRYNLHTTTNPYTFCLNDICFMGHSGQFINDMKKSTVVDDPIELMKLTLEIGHVGPTCPDTLACYPFYGKDPFILDQLPNVFFCGNQDEFKQDVYVPKYDKEKQIQLISLPKFSKSFSCVMFNLNTLKAEEYFF